MRRRPTSFHSSAERPPISRRGSIAGLSSYRTSSAAPRRSASRRTSRSVSRSSSVVIAPSTKTNVAPRSLSRKPSSTSCIGTPNSQPGAGWPSMKPPTARNSSRGTQRFPPQEFMNDRSRPPPRPSRYRARLSSSHPAKRTGFERGNRAHRPFADPFFDRELAVPRGLELPEQEEVLEAKRVRELQSLRPQALGQADELDHQCGHERHSQRHARENVTDESARDRRRSQVFGPEISCDIGVQRGEDQGR